MIQILEGDCLQQMKSLAPQSVHCCVTSPPYWGLRDYGCDGQIGLEKTPEEYVAKMVEVFREIRRVLREDGTVWLNLGDSYASSPTKGGSGPNGKNGYGEKYARAMRRGSGRADGIVTDESPRNRDGCTIPPGLKPKDLCGIPWRVAFALQTDGWYLRSDIIWHKSNPMPESVTDRPTKSHEYVFLMSKSARYYYDAEAIMEPTSGNAHARKANGRNSRMCVERAAGREQSKPNPSRSHIPGVTPKSAAPGSGIKANESFHAAVTDLVAYRNKRSVWTVATHPFKSAHFATFPPKLIEPCILAGCVSGGTVLDPFGGSGTTGQVALELGRNAILIELNPDYVKLARDRTNITPGLTGI
jgi:DNA modification methylase